MDINATMWALQQLRPGVAWNIRGEKIEQAIDSTPRVEQPTAQELTDMVAQYQAPLSSMDRIAALEQKVQELTKSL